MKKTLPSKASLIYVASPFFGAAPQPTGRLEPVPERRNNTIPGINVPYFRANFIPGINSVPERRNSAIQGINMG